MAAVPLKATPAKTPAKLAGAKKAASSSDESDPSEEEETHKTPAKAPVKTKSKGNFSDEQRPWEAVPDCAGGAGKVRRCWIR